MKALLAPLLLLALLGTAPTKPYIFTPNTPAQSAQVNADFDILYNAFQNVDNTNVGPAGFFASQIAPLNTAQATVGGTVPLLFPNGLLANTPTVYNVKSPPFNAYGDNVHDDTSAIQTAITSAAAVGGTVFIPPGTYRTSAAFVVDNIGNSGGVIIEGAGMGLYGACLPASSAGGSVIAPTSATADVFDAIGSGATSGSMMGLVFRDLQVNRSCNTTATAGTTFNFSHSSSVDVSDVRVENVLTQGDYDDIHTGGGPTLGEIEVFNSRFLNSTHYGVDNVGTIGGLRLDNDFFSAVGNTGSSRFFVNGGLIDPLFIHNVDVESYSGGFTQTSAGILGDYAEIDHTLIDGVGAAPAWECYPGACSGLVIDNNWFTSSANAGATVDLDSRGTSASYEVATQNVRVTNNMLSARNNYGLLIGGGSKDIVVHGNTIGSNTTTANIAAIELENLNYSPAVATSGIVITGNTLGTLFSTVSGDGIVITSNASNVINDVTISGNSMAGAQNEAVVIAVAVAGNVTNTSVTDNNLSGIVAGQASAVQLQGPVGSSVVIANNLGWGASVQTLSAASSGLACPQNGALGVRQDSGASTNSDAYVCRNSLWVPLLDTAALTPYFNGSLDSNAKVIFGGGSASAAGTTNTFPNSFAFPTAIRECTANSVGSPAYAVSIGTVTTTSVVLYAPTTVAAAYTCFGD